MVSFDVIITIIIVGIIGAIWIALFTSNKTPLNGKTIELQVENEKLRVQAEMWKNVSDAYMEYINYLLKKS